MLSSEKSWIPTYNLRARPPTLHTFEPLSPSPANYPISTLAFKKHSVCTLLSDLCLNVSCHPREVLFVEITFPAVLLWDVMPGLYSVIRTLLEKIAIPIVQSAGS